MEITIFWRSRFLVVVVLRVVAIHPGVNDPVKKSAFRSFVASERSIGLDEGGKGLPTNEAQRQVLRGNKNGRTKLEVCHIDRF